MNIIDHSICVPLRTTWFQLRELFMLLHTIITSSCLATAWGRTVPHCDRAQSQLHKQHFPVWYAQSTDLNPIQRICKSYSQAKQIPAARFQTRMKSLNPEQWQQRLDAQLMFECLYTF